MNRTLADIDRQLSALKDERRKLRVKTFGTRRPSSWAPLGDRKNGRSADAADTGYMRWQHESGLRCIACEIEGAPVLPPGTPNPLEVAHQKVNDPSTGHRVGMGPKVADCDSCPLCRWHHTGAPKRWKPPFIKGQQQHDRGTEKFPDDAIREAQSDLRLSALQEEVASLKAERDALVAKLPGREVQGWSLQSSIYEGFSAEIWADNAEPGKRTIAIVRDYSDAVKIMAALNPEAPQ